MCFERNKVFNQFTLQRKKYDKKMFASPTLLPWMTCFFWCPLSVELLQYPELHVSTEETLRQTWKTIHLLCLIYSVVHPCFNTFTTILIGFQVALGTYNISDTYADFISLTVSCTIY